MAFTAIASAAVAAGKAVKQELMDLIRTNFDDHESRIGSLEAATVVDGFLVGEVREWAGSTLPSGFLYCDGSAVSRTTYADLFAVISTTYGVGDGSTTFNLPDCRGRATAGKDNMDNTVGTGGGDAGRLTSGGSGIDGDTLGASGGTETHTLSTAELSSHTHTISDPGHDHDVAYKGGSGGGLWTFDDSVGGAFWKTDTDPGYNQTAGPIVSATTGITATAASGSGNAHQNTAPTIVMNKIIYSGV